MEWGNACKEPFPRTQCRPGTTRTRTWNQALHNPRNREHSNLKASLLQLGLTAQQIVLQWLPGHCNIWGNTRADQLAKEGSQLEQLDGGSSYAESKTLVKAAMARKWKSDHPDSDPSDPIHGMTRSQQTTIFRLRTGHNRLRQHMYKRFKVGDSEICPCGQAPQNTEHVLQTCSSHKQLRARTWPNHTPLEKKLYGTTEELALTVDYIVASGLTVWQTAAGRTKKKKKKNLEPSDPEAECLPLDHNATVITTLEKFISRAIIINARLFLMYTYVHLMFLSFLPIEFA